MGCDECYGRKGPGRHTESRIYPKSLEDITQVGPKAVL